MSMKLVKDIFLQWRQEEEKQPLQLEIYQSAYIHLTDWTSNRSFGNFWHLYWNARSGASVRFEGKDYFLNSKHVFLIPAHTLFSTKLVRPVPHFYIDFTLNSYLQNLKRGVYSMPVEYMREILPRFIRSETFQERKILLYSLIWHYLSLVRREDFLEPEEKKMDPRIAKAIEIMEKEMGSVNLIGKVCKRVNMSPNSFYLLFKRETNKTPLWFLTQLRIGRASYLLEHTEESIDEIALETAYSDRYHFSKRYKQKTGYTPVQYRIRSRMSVKNPAGGNAGKKSI
ncbi:MAG: Arabinose operon regulatory protein [Lentisphaerae bacterium ADurb.Bin242]|nr:MAG: Arabinose operon regulatory protein [Lentisphaerae bacterium ADurb.Bin242]